MKKTSFLLVSIIILFCITICCSKFKGDQTVPAYIQIDTIELITSASIMGITTSAKIVDAWVYVNDDLIGAFELPATFPVLSNGKRKISILPGVLLNGNSTTRERYPFYTMFEQELILKEDSVTKINNIRVQYKPTSSLDESYLVKFATKEGFEDINTAFDTIGSLVKDERFPTSQLFAAQELEAKKKLYGDWVDKISLTKTNNFCKMLLKDKYDELSLIYNLPNTFQAVFIEIDYCSNNSLVIGTKSYYGAVETDNDFLVLRSSNNTWKKAYINLTNRLNNDQLSNADAFKFYIVAALDSGNESAEIYIDNVRWVHFTK